MIVDLVKVKKKKKKWTLDLPEIPILHYVKMFIYHPKAFKKKLNI